MKMLNWWRSLAGDNALVKASGGVRDYATAEKYIKLGASRLGLHQFENYKGKNNGNTTYRSK